MVARKFLTMTAIGLLLVSCKETRREQVADFTPKAVTETYERGIYHWKTTFEISAGDSTFLKEHNINRLYIRMFDVGMEKNEINDSLEVVPLGTTRFRSKIPEGCTVIPTVFITQEALKAYSCMEWKLADLIITRVKAMCSWNGLGAFDELQYDCDWTAGTRRTFEKLCEATKKRLKEDGILLSGTIRLHQLEEATYPFDRGVLMMYNTGSFVNPNTKNSILDYDDVSKYLSSEERIRRFLKARETNCLKIDIAYPTFSWGVVFDEKGAFRKLVRDVDTYSPGESEHIRIEESDYAEIRRVKHLADSLLRPAVNGNIIYHLETDNLKKYSHEEIENIYNQHFGSADLADAFMGVRHVGMSPKRVSAVQGL